MKIFQLIGERTWLQGCDGGVSIGTEGAWWEWNEVISRILRERASVGHDMGASRDK